MKHNSINGRALKTQNWCQHLDGRIPKRRLNPSMASASASCFSHDVSREPDAQ